MRKHIMFVALAAMLLGIAQEAYGFYNPSTGRWLSRDPLGEKGVLALSKDRNGQRRPCNNCYGFVENNPLLFIDPDGLESVFVRFETEVRSPDPEAGTKTWHYVEINDYGSILSQQSVIGITESPFPLEGSGTLFATVAGTHPNFSVHFTGNAINAYFLIAALTPPLPYTARVLASNLQIDYDVTVSLNFCSHTGVLSGNHDGYPSYMAHVKGNKVYDFSQNTIMVAGFNFGILKLFPPMDVSPNVSFSW